MSKYLCVVANQRAGTTALRKALGGTGRFHEFGEIFHTDSPPAKGYFLEYAASRKLEVADFAGFPQVETVCREYLSYLEKIAADRISLIDVKFNSWGAIHPFWSYVNDRPIFLGILLDAGCRFIFIQRTDLTAQIVSEELARVYQKWVNLNEQDIKAPVTLDVQKMLSRARSIIRSEYFLYQFLPTRRTLAITYEELFDGEELAAGVFVDIARMMDVDLVHRPKEHLPKNSADKRIAVENYDEIDAAINKLISNHGRLKIDETKPQAAIA